MLDVFTDYRKAFRHIRASVDKTIAAGKTPVVSFDVFDTLVQRRVGPDLVLEGAARWLDREIEQRGLATRRAAMDAFHAGYARSAQANVAKGLDQEANTAELYRDWIEEALAEDGDPAIKAGLAEAVARRFDDIEIRTTYAAPYIVELLEFLKGRGCRVIYVSDMYIGDRCVATILKACGLFDFFDAGYVSGDYGLLKRTGNLFRRVLEVEGLSAADVLHIGDNKVADGEMASGVGLNAVVIEDATFFARRKALDKAFAETKSDPRWGGYLAALAAQGMAGEVGTRERAVTLRLLAPVFAHFMHKVLEKCRDAGVEKVYFCAREGFVLKELFNRMAPLVYGNGPAPRAEYLLVSRLSSLMASASRFGLRELSATLANGRPTVSNLFSFLRLPEDRLAEIAARYGIGDINQPLPPFLNDWTPFQELTEDPDIAAAIAANQEKNGGAFERYLERLGFFNHKKVAFVDVGWSGRIQEFLYQAVRKRDDAPAIRGFYMGTRLPAHWRKKPRNWMDWVITDDCELDWYAQACLLFPQLFEAAVRSPHGTVLGYETETDGTVRPVLKSEEDESRQFEAADDPLLAHVQMALFEYADHYATTAALAGLKADDTRAYALEALNRLVRFPRAAEAEVFLQLRNVSDLGSSEMLVLGNLKKGHWLIHPNMTRREIRNSFWKYGAASRFGSFIPQVRYMLTEEIRRVPPRGHQLDPGVAFHAPEDIASVPLEQVPADPDTAERRELTELEAEIGARIRKLADSYRSNFNFVELAAETRPLSYREIYWTRQVLIRLSKRLAKLGAHVPRTETLPLGVWKKKIG